MQEEDKDTIPKKEKPTEPKIANSIFRALMAFQQECQTIDKTESGYGYNYADLANIIESIKPILKKYNLGFYQAINGDILKTVVFYLTTGETIESETNMFLDKLEYELVVKYQKDNAGVPHKLETYAIRGFEGMNRPQAIGACITYFKRYALSSLLGIVTDKDTDANPTPITNARPR